MSAINRVLTEDGKKSIDLTTNILSIWFTFSMFSNFHALLVEMKIPESTVKIIEYELHRTRTLDEEKRKTDKQKMALISAKQHRLLYYSCHLLLNLCEDLSIELQLIRKNLIRNLIGIFKYSDVDVRVMVMEFICKLSIFSENKPIILKASKIRFSQDKHWMTDMI